MREEIVIKIGGTYDLNERKYQVLVLRPNNEPMICSHDHSIYTALDKAVMFIKSQDKNR